MKFKSKVSLLVRGIFLIFTAIVLQVIEIIAMLPEGKKGMIAIVFLTIFFSGLIAFSGIWDIREYLKSEKCLKNAINKYGKENIVSEIETATKISYQYPFAGRKVYFTDKFVVDPGIAIFRYDEIGMIYKYIKSSGNIRVSTIAFALLDGNTYYLCDCINDETLLQVMKHCFEHNPKIIIGSTKEHKLKYKKWVKNYKDGNVPIQNGAVSPLENSLNYKGENIPIQNEAVSPLEISINDKSGNIPIQNDAVNSLEFPTPFELTEKGRKYMKGSRLSFVGTFIMCGSLLLLILLPIIMNNRLDKQVNSVSQEAREELLDSGYEEYKITGGYVYCDVNYDLGEKSHVMTDIYVYEMLDKNDGYLGIVGTNKLEWYDSSVCIGFDIFYKGDVLEEEIEGKGETYCAKIIKKDDIFAIYGIPSEKNSEKKIWNSVISAVIFMPTVMVGFVMMISGYVIKRKARNYEEAK